MPAIVVGSGKGGVGKSIVATILAHSLAQEGAKVLLVDGDDELANLHVMLLVTPPVPVSAVMDGEASAADMIVPVSDGLWLCPGSSGSNIVRQAGPLDRGRLFNRIVDCFVDYDIVVIDAGAGIESVLRTCSIGGTNLLVVTSPDPAALTDAFAVMKLVRHQVPGFPIEFAVNRTLSQGEGVDASNRIQFACRRFLHVECDLYGVIPEDIQLGAHVRRGQSVLTLTNDNAAVEAVQQVARQYRARLGMSATAVTNP